MLLEDRVAIVSGVGPGLGTEVALLLAAEGAHVALASRTASHLLKVDAAVKEIGRRSIAVPTDIVDAGQCAALVAAAIAEFGRVDILVNNAAQSVQFARFDETDEDLTAWRTTMDVNFFGTLQLTRQVVPHMKERGGGSIVMIGSYMIRKPWPRCGGYVASKGALNTVTPLLAEELGPYGIRVNSVVPGWMWGPVAQDYLSRQSMETGVPVASLVTAIAERIPLRAIPEDGDCAQAVLFLASDMSKAVTGQALDVNGGEVFH